MSPLLLGSSLAGTNLATAQGTSTAVKGRLVEKDFEFSGSSWRSPNSSVSGKVNQSLTGSGCDALPSLWHCCLFQQLFRAKEHCLLQPELSAELGLFSIPLP